MGKISSFSKYKIWILKVIQLQLFLSLISLPILILWGLPISLASPIGNILFTPILALFLLLSSLIFFLELIGIPNSFLIYCLEKLSIIWMEVFKFSSSKWLITLPIVSNTILIFIPLVALGILQNKKTNSLIASVLALFIVLTSFAFFLRLSNKPKTGICTTQIDDKKVTIMNVNNKISVIDLETISKIRSPEVFIEYSLQPYLIKTFGHTKIDTLIIKKNSKSISAIKYMLKIFSFKKIYFLATKKNSFSEETQLMPLVENLQKNYITTKYLSDYNLSNLILDISLSKL